METDEESGFAEVTYGVCHSALEKMGERTVISKLHLGDYGVVGEKAHMYVSAWLKAQEFTRLEKAQKKTVQSAIATAWATIFLVVITAVGVAYQIFIGKELLAVQISVELDKQFESPEMRQARKRLATQLLNNKVATGVEARVPLFLDKLGLYAHQGRIDRATVYHSYVYWVERYWQALKPSVDEFRKQENDPTFWVDFERLYDDMLVDDAKDGLTQPSKEEILRFLKEEAMLPQ